MATATSKYPIGWRIPPTPPTPPAQDAGFTFVLETAMDRARPVQAVLVNHGKSGPVFLVLGEHVGATVEAAGDQFRTWTFSYPPGGRSAFDADSRAQGFTDLETDGA